MGSTKQQRRSVASRRAGVIGVSALSLIALATLPVYAGVLTTTTPGDVGAGMVAFQASCASTAVINPDTAVWIAAEETWKYPTATVTYTANSNCENQEATVNVYADADGTALNTAAVKTITSGEVAALKFVVTFAGTGVDAAIVSADYKYGLVIQSSTV